MPQSSRVIVTRAASARQRAASADAAGGRDPPAEAARRSKARTIGRDVRIVRRYAGKGGPSSSGAGSVVVAKVAFSQVESPGGRKERHIKGLERAIRFDPIGSRSRDGGRRGGRDGRRDRDAGM